MVKLTAFPSVGVVPNAVDEEESVITKKTVRSHSLLHKFVIPFIFIVIGQAALFYFSTLWGGAIQQMELNAYEIFNQKVQNRKNYLQNDMIHRWSNIDDSVRLINAHWEQRLSQYPDTARLLADSDALDDFLMDTSDDLIYILRKNSVTGAFLILDQTIGERSAALSRPGLYVRDSDPESSTSDNSDLAIKNGSAQLYRSLGITTDIQWTPRIAFDSSDAAANSYFYRPMEAAREFPKLNIADLGYWSPPISTANDSRAAVTYSVPLIDSRGVAYGVLGIDLSVDYLKKMLPSGELHGNTQNAYCLAVYNQDTAG